MKEIFVDTSAFYALVDSKEPLHRPAQQFFRENQTALVTTNFIFAESLSLITKRLGKRIAVKFGGGLKNSRILRIAYLTAEHQERAWQIFCQQLDKDYDYIDCSCFVFMDGQRIKEAFTFDRHFQQRGYKMLPVNISNAGYEIKTR